MDAFCEGIGFSPAQLRPVLERARMVIRAQSATFVRVDANVPLGATSLALHDAVDQAVVPLLSKFPYLFTPTPGAQ